MKKLTLLAFSLSLFTSVAATAEPVDYLDWDGAKLVSATCTDYEVVTNGANVFAAGTTYVVKGEVSTTSRIIVEGTVASPTRLILCDGAKLTAEQGINVTESEDGATTNALVICGQQGGKGALVATGDRYAAGIGGWRYAGGSVTINGGMVTATGGYLAAGIGGGNGGAGGIVTINGGTVTATGSYTIAGIGCGYGGEVGTLQFAEDAPLVVWVGDSASSRYVPTAAFIEDHTARYVHIESGKVVLTLEGVQGYQTIVSNETGVVANDSSDSRYRAYIVPCGHTWEGKGSPGYQRGGVMGALAGFAAFVYEPFAQGERMQPPAGGCCDGHNHYGALAELLGTSAARQSIWDGMRALDYLESRADIRKDGFGSMGNSGGGTQTALMEERGGGDLGA